MDSGRGGRTSRSLPPSSSFPDSSIFNDITNLSPVRPCNDSSSPLPPLDHVFGSPRHNSQRGSNLSQRPQKPGSADAEQSLRENARPKILSATQGVSGPSASQLAVQSITCIHDHDSKVPTVVQPYSSSEGVNELLADSPKGFDRFTQSPDLLSSHPSKISQNNIRGTNDEVLVDNNVETDMENEMAPTTALPKEVEDVPKDRESCSLGNPTAKGDGGSSGGQADEDAADPITSSLSAQPTLGKQHELHSVDEAATTTASSVTNTEPGIVKDEEQKSFSLSGFHQLGIEAGLQVKKSTQSGDCDRAPELLPETFDGVQFHDVHNENKRTMNNQTMKNQMHYECKAPDQHHRGIRRRCLQFEGVEAGKKSIGSSSQSWNPANIVHDAVPPIPPIYANALNTMNAEQNVFSRNKRSANLQHHTSSSLPIYPCRMLESHIDNIDISARNNRDSMITGPVPPSVGLHLNRIGNSVAANCGLNVKLTGKDYLSLPGEKSPYASIRRLAEDSMGHLAPVNSFRNSLEKSTAKSESSLAYSVHINNEVGQDESQHSMTANSSNISQTANQMNSWNSSQHLNLTDQHELLHESKRTGSQDVYALDEFNQMSPRKKRKEETLSVEIESCKRCNCKKSKCLKLYCDCFAAGVYCVDSCSCQECLNRIEYEDTVFATRQQIESRNPLAFAPKIVRRVADLPQSRREDSNWPTATSARHKKGCNCKKSMCLKKYCECYQAGVGCSDGCRCEGCKNIFGKKEGSGEAMEMENRQVVDGEFVDSFSDGKIIMPETQGYISHPGQYISDSSLLASLYQCSNQDMILSTFQHPSRGHPTSSPQPDSSFLSQVNLNRGEMFLKEIKENAAVTPYFPELHYFETQPTNMFSPRLKGFSDMYSFITSDQYAQPISSFSGGRYPSKASQETMCHPTVLPSASSFHWPSSTFYPNLHSLGNKLAPDASLDGTLYNVLEGQHPIKLKDMHSTMPEKATSADEKHGSPPINCLEELSRTVPLPGLRESGKPIPKALSFPPQTDRIPE